VDELKRQVVVDQRMANDWKEKWNYQVGSRVAVERGRVQLG
jgi:hypothetical protein